MRRCRSRPARARRRRVEDVPQHAGALALLAGGAAGRGAEIGAGLRRVSEQLAESLEPLERAVTNVAIAFAYVGRMYVIGRGIEVRDRARGGLEADGDPAASRLRPLTATDLAHGPIAAVDALFPVWTIASRDGSLPIVVDAANRLREIGATVVASGNAAAEIEGAAYVLPVPSRRTRSCRRSSRSCRASSSRGARPCQGPRRRTIRSGSARVTRAALSPGQAAFGSSSAAIPSIEVARSGVDAHPGSDDSVRGELRHHDYVRDQPSGVGDAHRAPVQLCRDAELSTRHARVPVWLDAARRRPTARWPEAAESGRRLGEVLLGLRSARARPYAPARGSAWTGVRRLSPRFRSTSTSSTSCRRSVQ